MYLVLVRGRKSKLLMSPVWHSPLPFPPSPFGQYHTELVVEAKGYVWIESLALQEVGKAL